MWLSRTTFTNNFLRSERLYPSSLSHGLAHLKQYTTDSRLSLLGATRISLPSRQNPLPNQMATAVYSTATLKEQNAQRYDSLAGKLQAPLLQSLNKMGYEYVEASCAKANSENLCDYGCGHGRGTAGRCIYSTDIAYRTRTGQNLHQDSQYPSSTLLLRIGCIRTFTRTTRRAL